MRKSLFQSSSLGAILGSLSGVLVLALSSSALAAPTGPVAFSCSAKEGAAGFDLVITSSGEARAELNQDGKNYSCPLKISNFKDKRKEKVPTVTVTLSRAQACTPALPLKINRALKGKFALNLVKSGRKPASNVSFMNKKADASCSPTNFKYADFNALMQKWNGTSKKR